MKMILWSAQGINIFIIMMLTVVEVSNDINNVPKTKQIN